MKKKVKQMLVCNSNMFVPTVLTEVLRHPQDSYLVISDIKNIVLFMNFLNLCNVDCIDYESLERGLNFIRGKRNLLNQIDLYDIGQVVFFHAEFGDMANWLIKRLSKSTPIKYCRIYDKMPLPPYKPFLRAMKIKIKQKVFWGMDVDILDRGRPIPSLPDSFFSKICAEIIKMPIDRDIISDYVSKKLSCLKIHSKFVLLTGTVVTVGLCPPKEYEQLINQVLDLLGIENTVSKCHPRFNDLYGQERLLRQIPSYIPGNVMIESYDCYVGFESTLLVEAAVAGKKSVSLINLLPISVETKKHWIIFLDSRLNGKGIIFYPKDIVELEQLLNSSVVNS